MTRIFWETIFAAAFVGIFGLQVVRFGIRQLLPSKRKRGTNSMSALSEKGNLQ